MQAAYEIEHETPEERRRRENDNRLANAAAARARIEQMRQGLV